VSILVPGTSSPVDGIFQPKFEEEKEEEERVEKD
jgi:hypothetical protein